MINKGLHDYTRAFIENRAKESNIPIDQLGIEPVWLPCNSCESSCDACLEGSLEVNSSDISSRTL